MSDLKNLLKKNKLDADPNKALLEVIGRGDLALLKELDAAGAPVTTPGAATQLIAAAARAGQVEICGFLAEHGASIRVTDDRDEPVFQILLDEAKSVAALNVLLQHGYDPNEEGKFGYLGLRSAIRHEQKDLFDALIAAGARVDGRKGEPLNWCKRAVTLDWLLSAGADPSLPTTIFGSLLHQLTDTDDGEGITRLLQAGAKMTTNAAGWTPPMLAADRANPKPSARAAFEAAGHLPAEIVDSRLPAAVVAGDAAAIESLLAAGHLDAVDAHNASALLHALLLKKIDLAERLIDAGAAVATVDRRGRCALGESLQKRELFERLLAKEPTGECLAAALLAVCTKQDVTALQSLLTAGAQANAQAIVAVCTGAATYGANRANAGRCMEMLVKAGANPKGAEVEGVPVLEFARAKRLMEVVAALESATGAPIDYSADGHVDDKIIREFWRQLGHPNIDWQAAIKRAARAHLYYMAKNGDVDALSRLLDAGLPKAGLAQALRHGMGKSTRVMAFVIERIPHEAEILTPLLGRALQLRCSPATPKQAALVARLLALGAKADPQAGGPKLSEYASTMELASLRLLLAAGAKPNTTDFLEACFACRTDLVPVYLEHIKLDMDEEVALPPENPLASVREHLLSLPKNKTGTTRKMANEILAMTECSDAY